MNDRRHGDTEDSGERRRVEDLVERIDRLENQVGTLNDLVHELKGKAEVILAISGRVNGKVETLASFRTFATFAATVIVPLLVALLGGYFLLQSQAPAVTP